MMAYPRNRRRPMMTKITTLFTALMVALSMTAFAADKAADVTPADSQSAQTDVKKSDGTRKAHHRKHHGNKFYGEVKAVDAKSGTVTVSRGEKTFTADEKLLSGVKVGDRISVRFTEKDGQLTATDIKPAKAHHTKKEGITTDEKKPEEKK
jgi:Cu/Ag efflux protein CusF